MVDLTQSELISTYKQQVADAVPDHYLHMGAVHLEHELNWRFRHRFQVHLITKGFFHEGVYSFHVYRPVAGHGIRNFRMRLRQGDNPDRHQPYWE